MFKWIEKLKEEKLTVNVARKNHQKYLDSLKLKQQEYKLELCNDIRRRSQWGHTSIFTHSATSYCGFITREYLENDLKSYFESKGFTTRLVEYHDGDCYLRISWGEE